MTAPLGLIAGFLADRRGANRAHLVAGGVLLTALTALGIMFANNIPQLVAPNLALGVGSGVVIAMALALAGGLSSWLYRALALVAFWLGFWAANLATWQTRGWDPREELGLYGAIALAVAPLVFV